MPRIAQRTIDAVNDLSIVDVVEHCIVLKLVDSEKVNKYG